MSALKHVAPSGIASVDSTRLFSPADTDAAAGAPRASEMQAGASMAIRVVGPPKRVQVVRAQAKHTSLFPQLSLHFETHAPRQFVNNRRELGRQSGNVRLH